MSDDPYGAHLAKHTMRERFKPLGCNTGDGAFDNLQANINRAAYALIDVLNGTVPYTCGRCGHELNRREWMDRRQLIDAGDTRHKELHGSYAGTTMSLALSELGDQGIVKAKIGKGIRLP